MARKGPSPSAKGKAKAYGPLTRASPRLAAGGKSPTQNTSHSSHQCTNIKPADEEVSDDKIHAKKEPDHKIAGKEENVEEDPEEGPEEVHQDAGTEEEEEEEDLEEDPEEDNAAEEGVRVEDDFADYWALVRSDSKNNIGNDYRFAGNAGPTNSSTGSCTGPPPANH
ncbi:hypothetical protein PIB30_095452 [Stylosanthes scabra]|uniref:Uncharacterized protein n=1 Tax=Stylosanthes scabra TaxID=79078 RepID=A0ABU6UUI7_9FABA|nr:hypothetical protein [Stylosanthes scabra]